MKKTIAVLLMLALLCSLAACGGTVSEESSQPAESSSASAAAPSASPTPTPEPEPDPKTLPENHSVEAIQANGELVCAIYSEETWWSSMSFPEDVTGLDAAYQEYAGQYVGYDVFIVNQIAADLGVPVRYVVYDDTSATAMAAANGDADISAAFFGVSDEEPQIFAQSSNYALEIGGEYCLRAVNYQSVIQSEEELSTARIAVVTGSDQMGHVQETFPNAVLVEYADNDAALKAVIEGETDAAVFGNQDNIFSEKLAAAMRAGTVNASEYAAESQDYQVGLLMMLGNESLNEFVNRCIVGYRMDGQLQAWYDKSYQMWLAIAE